MAPGGSTGARERLRFLVRGAVQGVGFRPFVYRLATGLGLDGWVSNSGAGVHIDVEGDPGRLAAFRTRLREEKPASSLLQSVEVSVLDPCGYTGFTIRPSAAREEARTLILPDLATCPDCLAELFDPRTGAIGIRSSTARSAARASPSSGRCPTTGPILRCGTSPSVRNVRGSITTPRTGVFMHSRWRAPHAAPTSGSSIQRGKGERIVTMRCARRPTQSGPAPFSRSKGSGFPARGGCAQ